MSAPYWLTDALVATMLAISLYCVARLAGAALGRGAVEPDVECAHVLMGVSMVGMLIPGLSPLPAPVYELLFAAATVWFAGRLLCQARRRCQDVPRLGGHAPHLIHSVAMLLMLLAAGAAAHVPTAGHSIAGTMVASSRPAGLYATLTFVFALVLAGLAVWDIDRLSCCATRLCGAPKAAAGVPGGLVDSKGGAGAFAGSAGGACRRRTGDHAAQDGASGAVITAPALTLCCRIVIGITMAYMMIVMR